MAKAWPLDLALWASLVTPLGWLAQRWRAHPTLEAPFPGNPSSLQPLCLPGPFLQPGVSVLRLY